MKKYNCKHIGEKHITNEGYELTIIDGGSKYGFCTIQIKDWVIEQQYYPIKKGQIHYPYHKSVYNTGYLGEGKYKVFKNNKHTKEYKLWRAMIGRCYSKKQQQKQPNYKNVKVCKEWHNFQNFAEWFYKESNYKEGWELDKDLLSETNNKIYSPETCIFMPHQLNIFIQNVYSNNKCGLKGVSFNKSSKKYTATIYIKGKNKLLGYFNTKEEAYNIYTKEKLKQLNIILEQYKHAFSDIYQRKIRAKIGSLIEKEIL